MTHLRHLCLADVLHDDRADEVLRAISTCMPQLRLLDISSSKVSLSGITYLLPNKNNLERGCPELEVLSLWEVKNINVEFLKSVIIGLPKLQDLVHLLMINVLAELTDEEASLGSFKCLNRLQLPVLRYRDNSSTGIDVRYDILQKAPKFASSCNITNMVVSLERHSAISITDLLMPLAKLDSITLHGLSKGHEGLLTVLESKGPQLKSLNLFDATETVSFRDITNTCPFLNKFSMTYAASSSFGSYSTNSLENNTEQEYDQYGLFYLSELTLGHLSEQLCSRRILTALLVSPYLKTVNLTNVQRFDDDVMSRVQSQSLDHGLSTLTSVEHICMEDCPNITATAFVRLLCTGNTLLKDIYIKDCARVDGHVLCDAAAKYPRPLNVIVGGLYFPK